MMRNGFKAVIGMAMTINAIAQNPVYDNPAALHFQDSIGNVPAVRIRLTTPSTATTWWKRTMESHLLDFSDAAETGNKVVVDPVVDAHWGTLRHADSELEATSVWDNIRGARFQARIDNRWFVGGELLERQGIAEPLLGLWAAQNRIPGWGRSKLGKDNGLNSADRAYFDVSQTRGWVGWQKGNWQWDTGIDALHIGNGRNSAFLSRQAVPAPYARISWGKSGHRTSLWSTRWMTTRRGPLGETAESLLERSRSVFLTHSRSIGIHWIVQGVYTFTWETTALTVPEGWQSLGMDAGDAYRPHRHIAGLDLQFHQNFGQKGKLIAYGQVALDAFNGGNGTPLTSLLGTRIRWGRWSGRMEYTRLEAEHCRDCWDYGDGIENGPYRAVLENGGISVNALWSESLRGTVKGALTKRISIHGAMETNSYAQMRFIHAQFQLHPTWPISLEAGLGSVQSEANGLDYITYHVGLRSGILTWK